MLCNCQIKLIPDCVRRNKHASPTSGVSVSTQYFKSN